MKKSLRKECLAKRNAIKNRTALSKLICDKLTDTNEYKTANNILCYSSFGSEVETKGLLRRILADGKGLYLPKCEKATHTMYAVRAEDLAKLQKGAYGILEPVGEEVSPQDIDLVIVPLAGFDRERARLGYGGGYYDRFLPKTGAKRIAVAFSAQEADKIPMEETDALMDKIITEKEVI